MQKYSVFFTTLSLLLTSLFINSSVFAGDIEWNGLYRIEGYRIENSELRGSDKREIGYGLSHLVLRPKITAGDGVTIYGQFDIFNSPDYPNTQMGQVWGDGVRGSTPSKSQQDSNTLSQTQKAEAIDVTQLYLTYNSEFGQLLVGRAPLQFGLGITHNAGRGLFDHYYDTRDMVAYKVIFGNIYFLPMIAKPSGGGINTSDNLDDYMIQVQYENPESDLELGIFYELRHGGDQGSDAPIQANGGVGAIGGANATNNGTVNTKIVNVYALRDTERFRLGLEASFMSGESGVITASSDKVTWGGYGVAFEGEYRPENSNWKWGLKFGSASGDDPTSDAKYEGFTFNRNYDVAMLLFNHPLGQADFLRTGLTTGQRFDGQPSGAHAVTTNINRTDVEAISNAIYFAPVARYAFNDHWSLDNSIITGYLGTNPMLGQNSKALGYEWDATLTYAPRKGIAWVNQFGLLLPGAAWKGDGSQLPDGSARYENAMAFGFGTKAAISF